MESQAQVSSNVCEAIRVRVYPEIPMQLARPHPCVRIAQTIGNRVKPFFVGAALGIGLIMPIQGAITLIAQHAKYIPWHDCASFKPALINPLVILQITALAPIAEEIVFRFLIQDVILTRIPKCLIKRIMPGQETILDSKIAKVVRIILTASLFSLVHFGNLGTYPVAYVTVQVFASFFSGIGYGVLKESKWGLLATIGAHCINNTVAVICTLLS